MAVHSVESGGRQVLGSQTGVPGSISGRKTLSRHQGSESLVCGPRHRERVVLKIEFCWELF